MKRVRLTGLLAAVTLAMAAGACNQAEETSPDNGEAAARQAPSAQELDPETRTDLRRGCPMVVEGARVDVQNTDEGVALTFATDEGDVDDLRARVEHMAQMYEMHRGRGHMMWHRMGTGPHHRGAHHGPGREHMGGPGHMGTGGAMPGARADVEEIDNGARLVLRPTDPDHLEELRERARWQRQRMQSGECWLLRSE